MKKIRIKIITKRLLVIYLQIVFNLAAVLCQFDNLGVGARGSGMSNAQTSITDDIYSLFYNPAGLERIHFKEMGIDYRKLHLGLKDNSDLGNYFFAYGQHFGRMGKINLNSVVAFGLLNFSLSGYYVENTLMLAYATKIPKNVLPILDNNLRAAVKLKLITKEYKQTMYTENAVNLDTGELRNSRDPVFANGYSKTSLSVDMGLIYDINKNNSFGIMLADINRPNMGFIQEDSLPVSAKIGYSYKISKFAMAADTFFSNNDFILSCGAERWFMENTVALRSGLSLGSREYKNFAVGASYRYDNLLQFDYSFNMPLGGITQTLGSHQISITLKFGYKVVEEDYDRILKEKQQLETEMQKLKVELENVKKSKAESEKETEGLDKQKFLEMQEREKLLQRKLEIAEEELKKLKTEIKRQPEQDNRALIKDYWAKAYALYESQNYEEAISWLEKILSIDAEHDQSKKLLKQAKEKFERLNLIKEYWNVGFSLFNQKRYKDSIKWFEKILELNPQHEQSQRLIKQAKEKQTEEVEKNYTEGLRFYHQGNLKEAVNSLQKALDADPSNEEIRLLINRVKRELELKNE